MNTVTATFANLDYNDFDQLMEDRNFLRLSLVSFKVVNDKYLTLVLKGNYDMIRTFTNWVNNPKNWTKEALTLA
jgi:hypothetical protein